MDQDRDINHGAGDRASSPQNDDMQERSKTVQAMEMNVVSFEDVYAGKLCAALSRKHPRDLFDVMILYESEGVRDALFRIFMVYVACSNRPMHELLAPTIPVQESWYDRRFLGMTPNKGELSSKIRINAGGYLSIPMSVS